MTLIGLFPSGWCARMVGDYTVKYSSTYLNTVTNSKMIYNIVFKRKEELNIYIQYIHDFLIIYLLEDGRIEKLRSNIFFRFLIFAFFPVQCTPRGKDESCWMRTLHVVSQTPYVDIWARGRDKRKEERAMRHPDHKSRNRA